MTRLQIPYKGKTKHIGTIEDGIMKRTVDSEVHLFRALDAWGIDHTVFDTIIRNKADKIQFYDKATGIRYRTTFEVFERFGIKQMPEYEEHREQIFLPRDYFNQVKFIDGEYIVTKEQNERVQRFRYPERFEDKQASLF